MKTAIVFFVTFAAGAMFFACAKVMMESQRMAATASASPTTQATSTARATAALHTRQ